MAFVRLVGLAILASVLTACGGGGGSSPPPPTTAPVAAAQASLSYDTKTLRFSWTDVSDATYYQLLENSDGISGFITVGSTITTATQSYDHIIPLYKRINASYILQSCNTIGCTDSTTINVSTTLVEAIGYFKASNNGASDQFGAALSLSSDGSTLAIGAKYEDSNSNGINTTPDEAASDAGAVYVFIRSGANWTEQAYIKASNSGANDYFGAAVSLSSDGNTLAVGAYGEDSNSNGINTTPDEAASDAGAAYVYIRSGANWTEQAYIKASNSGAGDSFGTGLSLSSDGNTLAVGAQGEASSTSGINTVPDEAAAFSGAAYVYIRSGTTWTEQAYIKASNSGILDSFGGLLSLSSDGNTLAVEAQGEDSSTRGINTLPDEAASAAGAAYVFIRSGTTWTEQAYIKASNSGADDTFGIGISLSGDGDTLAVGARYEDSSTSGIASTPDEAASDAGAVYVFSRSGTTWSEQAYIKASNSGANDYFGAAVSLSSDGNSLAVGASREASSTSGIDTTPDEAASAAGAAYVFSRSGSIWAQQAYVKASNSGAGDSFGTALSLSGDGNSLAVGAYLEDSSTSGINTTPNESAGSAGAVYLY